MFETLHACCGDWEFATGVAKAGESVSNVQVHSLPLGALAVASAMAGPVLVAGVVVAALRVGVAGRSETVTKLFDRTKIVACATFELATSRESSVV